MCFLAMVTFSWSTAELARAALASAASRSEGVLVPLVRRSRARATSRAPAVDVGLVPQVHGDGDDHHAGASGHGGGWSAGSPRGFTNGRSGMSHLLPGLGLACVPQAEVVHLVVVEPAACQGRDPRRFSDERSRARARGSQGLSGDLGVHDESLALSLLPRQLGVKLEDRGAFEAVFDPGFFFRGHASSPRT